MLSEGPVVSKTVALFFLKHFCPIFIVLPRIKLFSSISGLEQWKSTFCEIEFRTSNLSSSAKTT